MEADEKERLEPLKSRGLSGFQAVPCVGLWQGRSTGPYAGKVKLWSSAGWCGLDWCGVGRSVGWLVFLINSQQRSGDRACGLLRILIKKNPTQATFFQDQLLFFCSISCEGILRRNGRLFDLRSKGKHSD